MNKRQILVLLLGLGLGCAFSAGAETVYRWVDQDGVVHFGGEPPADVPSTIVSAGRDTSGLAAPTEPDASSPDGVPATGQPADKESISYAEQRRRERAQRREEQMKANAERNQKCAAMRQQRDALEPSTRVIVNDENGNPVRMADEDRLARLDEAKTYLAKNCR